MNDVFRRLMAKQPNAKLELDELACALYEGTPHLQNLAENLARKYGKASALTFYEHAEQWECNKGSACVLSDQEMIRLKSLPRVLPE